MVTVLGNNKVKVEFEMSIEGLTNARTKLNSVVQGAAIDCRDNGDDDFWDGIKVVTDIIKELDFSNEQYLELSLLLKNKSKDSKGTEESPKSNTAT